MKTKNEYIDSMAADLKEWGAKIDVLTAKTEKAAGMAKLKYVQEMNLLRAKQTTANKKMTELKEDSGDAWEKIKETADKVCDDLRIGLASATAKFN